MNRLSVMRIVAFVAGLVLANGDKTREAREMRKQIFGLVVVVFLFIGLTATVVGDDRTPSQTPDRGLESAIRILPIYETLLIPAGDDFFETAEPSGFFLPIIGPGFFGSLGDGPSAVESDPIVDLPFIQVRGVPTGPLGLTPSPFLPTSGENGDCTEHEESGGMTKHCIKLPDDELEETDSIVRRLQDIALEMGESATTPIQIISLSQVSLDPVEVTYGSGALSQFFAVRVDLDRILPDPVGTMIVTRTGGNSGVFSSSLPVAFRLTFINTDPSGPSALEPITGETVLVSDDDPWEIGVCICHVPPGNPANAHTICIGESAVNAHVGHGDTAEPCVGSTPLGETCDSAPTCNDLISDCIEAGGDFTCTEENAGGECTEGSCS